MNSERERIFIYGTRGHAKVVFDIVEKQDLYEIACLIDDNEKLKDSTVYGYRVIGGKSELLAYGVRKGIVAIGSNMARYNLATWVMEQGFELVTAIHPSAQIGRGVVIGRNSVVMAGAVINSDSVIGNCVIVNTRAGIDHDCVIGDGVHIAPGATLCGAVSVGVGTFVCAGATIIPNLAIGRNVVVGAGATVIRNVSDGMTVVGVVK